MEPQACRVSAAFAGNKAGMVNPPYIRPNLIRI
jgi:hypothetical protein